MLKTILVDGDKGGVGRSLATRALVQFYLEQPVERRPRLIVFDADHSNLDVSSRDGPKPVMASWARASSVCGQCSPMNCRD